MTHGLFTLLLPRFQGVVAVLLPLLGIIRALPQLATYANSSSHVDRVDTSLRYSRSKLRWERKACGA